MDAAMQGIAYWCDDFSLVGKVNPEHEGMWTSQLLSKGYRVRVHDDEDDKTYILTKAKLLKGWALMDNLDIDNYDMNDADSVIQYALFGEQVYA